MESFRKADMQAEKMLGNFMDHNFYSKLHDRNGDLIDYERLIDKESQLQGIDVKINVDGRTLLIDEKASFYYSNAMIPTFAFEIDSIQKNRLVDGWFINDSLLTEYYMLIWPNVKCQKDGDNWLRKNISEIKESDFTIIEAMLVEKKKLLAEVAKHGFPVSRLKSYANEMRSRIDNGNARAEETLDDDIRMVYSGFLAEKPVNAVLQKRLLKQIASAIYLISEDGYARI